MKKNEVREGLISLCKNMGERAQYPGSVFLLYQVPVPLELRKKKEQ